MEERQEEVQTGCREEQKQWADKNFTFCNRMLRLALCVCEHRGPAHLLVGRTEGLHRHPV